MRKSTVFMFLLKILTGIEGLKPETYWCAPKKHSQASQAAQAHITALTTVPVPVQAPPALTSPSPPGPSTQDKPDPQPPTPSTPASATTDVSESGSLASESEEEEVEIQISPQMPHPARLIPAFSFEEYSRVPPSPHGFTFNNTADAPQAPSRPPPRAPRNTRGKSHKAT
jgi:hypothetical protein